MNTMNDQQSATGPDTQTRDPWTTVHQADSISTDVQYTEFGEGNEPWPFIGHMHAQGKQDLQDKISHVRVVLTQDKDCCDMGDDVQEMTVTVEDGGGGPFLVIDTERWALDLTEIDRFIAKLRKIQGLYEGF